MNDDRSPLDDNSVALHRYGNLPSLETIDHSIIVKRALDRVNIHNQNYLGFIYGPTGSGKSYSALAYAEACNPDFTIDNIVMKPRQFFDLLRDPKFRNYKGVKVLMWDEMGVGLPAKEWYSFQNKAISYILQTFRVNNIIFLGTAPGDWYIDSAVRPLFHQFFETVRIRRRAEVVEAKPFDIVKKRKQAQPWVIYPKFRFSGAVIQVKRVLFGRPSIKLEHAYEALHKEWKTKLQDEMGAEVDSFEAKKAYGRMTPEEIIAIIGDRIEPFLRADPNVPGLRRVDRALIELKFGIGGPMAYKVKRYLETTFKDKVTDPYIKKEQAQ
jgi:hypothetical protein